MRMKLYIASCTGLQLVLLVGYQQQPVAYDDTAADEDVRIEYVRGFVYRISLLAGIFYLPDTYRYVYEAV